MSATLAAPSVLRSRDAARLGPFLVATDGSPASDAAIVTARAMLHTNVREPLVLSVLDPVGVATPDFGFIPTPIEVDRARTAAARERIREQMTAAGVSWPVEVRTAPVPATLAETARQIGASAIIMGLTRHGLVDRVLGEETVLGTLARSEVPVLAVPPGPQALPTRAVAAVDFSESSLRAVRTMLQLLPDVRALYLVHVIPRAWLPDEFLEDSRMRTVDGDPLTTEVAFARFIDALEPPASLVIEQVERRGDPATEAVQFAREVNADLLVVGSHGHGFVARLLLGSVTRRIIRASSVAVLATPPRAGTDSQTAWHESTQASHVPRAAWPDAIREFSRRNAGKPATLVVQHAYTGPRVQAHGHPLLDVSHDSTDGSVLIVLGEDGSRYHLSHRIPGVWSVEMLEDEAKPETVLRISSPTAESVLRLSRG